MSMHAVLMLAVAMSETTDMQADIDIVRERLIARYLPSAPEAFAGLRRQALESAESLQADGSWPDIDYADEERSRWAAGNHLGRLRTMAAVCHGDAGAAALNEDLLAATRRALDFWLEKDLRNPNWWWNQIGVQLSLGPALILLGDMATPEQRAAGVEVMNRSAWTRWTGQNLVWGVTIQIMRGCVENDAAVIQEAYDRMYDEIRVFAPGEESVQSDFSFHQHGSQLYSGGYGLGFAQNGAEFIHHARGTRFGAPAGVLEVMTGYVLDGQQWMMRGQTFDYSAVGREIVRPGKNGGAMLDAAARLAEVGGPRRDEFEAYVVRMKTGGKESPLIGNRHFWRSDYMTHHRPGYFASVRMASTRNQRSELVNGEGPRSHHLADGVMYLYQTGLEYRDIFPVWDWQRVPGITGEQMDWADKGRVGGTGETAFAGGASDGDYGVAAMDFRRGALSARKAWFFFDDAIVCLGAGLACSSANPVLTSVNQCLLNGPVTVSGRAEPLGPGAHDLPAPGWAHHDRVGYVFPTAGSIRIEAGNRTGRWSDIGFGSDKATSLDVFDLWIDHGPQPAGAEYVYMVYPDVDAAAFAARMDADDFAVLSNTPAAQAALHKPSGIVQAAFYEPGSVTGPDGWTLRVDKPCLVLLRAGETPPRAAVSNPVNEPLDVVVEWTGRDGAAMTAAFSLPDGPEAGGTVVKPLEVAGR